MATSAFMPICAPFRFISAQNPPTRSTVHHVCYPDHVLFHVRLRDLTEQQVEVLAETPGFHCILQDDDTALVSITFAHNVPSHPDLQALESRLRLALEALVPGADIVEIRGGERFTPESGSPTADALHRLRRDVNRVSNLDGVDRDDLAEVLRTIYRDFTELDALLCNGASVPTEWARRHPEGDRGAARQVADAAPALVMAG